MIRAVMNGGVFRPLDPVPTDWAEGHEVTVQDPEDDQFTAEELDAWLQRGNELAAEMTPQEGADLMAELDRLRAEQKDLMRRRSE
jgi:hypothetical protein